jgi:N utilization substance protein A
MSELTNTIKQICEEKGLSMEAVVATIESALAAAYRKDFGEKNQNVKVEFDTETGGSKVFDVKTVVEDMPEEEILEDGKGTDKDDKPKIDETPKKKSKVKEVEESAEGEKVEEEERKFNPRTEIQISDIKLIKKTAKVGDEIKTKLEVPGEFGRMAAQTAKQVIIQRLREAERDMIFNEFKDKEKEVLGGVVQRREGRIVLVDLGKAVGVLPGDEQIYGEQYKPGARIKVYVKEVKVGSRGPEIILSRTSDEILKKIFYLEIPEISNGLVELKAVAREAGARSKVAVSAASDNIDPIGACVGQRGARIQTIISELGGEKVDIIQYDEDLGKFISNALSPAKILSIDINEKENKATVKVNADQLSLAIGKGGQNVRLAARLTGWRIDIQAPAVEKTEDKKSEPLIDTENTEDTEIKKSEDKKKDKKEDKKTKQEKTKEEKENGKDSATDKKSKEKNKKEKKGEGDGEK